MKYKTFRNSAIVGGLALLGVGAYALGTRSSPPPPSPRSEPVAASVPVAAAVPAQQAPVDQAPLPLSVEAGSRHASYLLRLLGKKTSEEKIKDGMGRGDPKVNVYAEGGRWARAKVDLDRDEKWDEKWWLKNNEILRATSPADDERYGDSQLVGAALE